MADRKFPLNSYDNESDHWFVMTEYKYFRVSNTNRGEAKDIQGTYKLPLPQQLLTDYSANWGETSLGLFGNEIANETKNVTSSARNIIDRITGATGKDEWQGKVAAEKNNFIKSLASDIINIGGRVASAAGGLALDTALNNSLGQQIGLYAGVARNPFISMVYTGPNLRSFNFSWELVPKNKQETEELNNLIKDLKFGMHPAYKELVGYQNALFEYPSIYKPRFSHPEYLFDFGFCVIKNLSVDYHSQGKIYHGVNNTKAPVAVRIALQLAEVEVVTKETINSNAGSRSSSIPAITQEFFNGR